MPESEDPKYIDPALWADPKVILAAEFAESKMFQDSVEREQQRRSELKAKKIAECQAFLLEKLQNFKLKENVREGGERIMETDRFSDIEMTKDDRTVLLSDIRQKFRDLAIDGIDEWRMMNGRALGMQIFEGTVQSAAEILANKLVDLEMKKESKAASAAFRG